MTMNKDFESFAKNTVHVSEQITAILGNHVSDAINPDKVSEVLARAIAAHILTRSDEDANITAFRKTFNEIFERDDIEEMIPDLMMNWNTDKLSPDAKYDIRAVYKDLTQFIYEYVGQQVPNKTKFYEVLAALAHVHAVVIYRCFSDDEGLVSKETIEGTMDWVEDTVHASIPAVKQWCRTR
jgi:hypothetical protein